MRRRGFSLADAGVDEDLADEGPAPMETLVNLFDAMLVLVCALMLAVVTQWGTGVAPGTGTAKQIGQENLKPLEDSGATGGSASSSGPQNYEEVGKVYRDVTTGKMYVVDSANASESASAAATEANGDGQ